MTPLTERGKQIRRDTLRLGIPNGIYHYGGAFSVVEILIALYDHVATDDDKIIMSKGHAWIPQVVILRERGLNPGWGPRLDNGEMCLLGHPALDPANGIWATTGSLGHGMPIGVGMAVAGKLQEKSGRIFVIIGDGEAQEGTFFESLLLATKFGLKNLCVIVDSNKIQGSGRVEDILPLPNLAQVAELAGWETHEIDGHDLTQLSPAIHYAICTNGGHDTRPSLIVASTIKGRGVSLMEGRSEWHAKFPTKEELEEAYRELETVEVTDRYA